MNPFHLLGIDWGSNEISIKRAYARLLRTTRPDDDPEGFQRLNEAYQAALAYARQPPEWGEDEWDDGQEAAVTAESAHAAVIVESELSAIIAHEHPPFDNAEPASAIADETPFEFNAFYGEAIEQANGWDDASLWRWLGNREDLYHLGFKQTVGSAFFQRLQNDPDATLPPGRIEVLCRFFGINEDFWWSRRMAVRSAIKRGDTAAYGEPRPLALRELRRPFSLWRATWMSCMPGLSKRIAALGDRLSGDYGGIPEALDEAQISFHRQQADPAYFGRNRWLQILLLSLLAGLAGYTVAAYLVLVELKPVEALTRLPQALVIPGYAALSMAVSLLALQGFMRLHSISHGALAQNQNQRALLPLYMALAGLALDALLPDNHWAAYAVVVPAALLHWRRTFDALRFLLGGIWMHPALQGYSTVLSQGVLGFAMVPVGIALFDGLYARNHGVPLAAAAGNRWTTIASYAFCFGWLLQSLLPK